MTTKGRKTSTGRQLRLVSAQADDFMPSSGAVDDLVREISQRRDRPIRVIEEDLGPNEPSGLWIATERNDWIVVPTGIGSAQRRAIICHELAHILLEHEPLGSPEAVDELASLIAPHIALEVARRFLTRFSYADDLEAEAEELGTVLVTKLLQRATILRVVHDGVSDRLR